MVAWVSCYVVHVCVRFLLVLWVAVMIGLGNSLIYRLLLDNLRFCCHVRFLLTFQPPGDQ